MATPILPMALRPYIFHELPAWGRLYEWIGAGGRENENPLWRSAPNRIIRGKLHGYLMELDLSDDLDRGVYFVGRYYDVDNQLLLDAILRQGDTFIDVGANVGHMTLHAASRVGPQGRVISFEPHPECCRKMRRNLELNDIRHVEMHNCGLGERPDKLELKKLGATSIMSSLCIDETNERSVRERFEVEVLRGDDVVADRVVGNLMIKVDVEGFELYVLRGLERTISRYHPPILTEVVPRFLRRAGTSVEELFAFFHDRGYTGYGVSLRKRDLLPLPGSRRSTFTLCPVPAPDDLHGDMDVLWLPKEAGRFDPAPHLVQPGN